MKNLILLSLIPIDALYFFLTDVIPTETEGLILLNIMFMAFVLSWDAKRGNQE